jgi:ATP/maltotriose-dependent transcriptional regulator MalT
MDNKDIGGQSILPSSLSGKFIEPFCPQFQISRIPLRDALCDAGLAKVTLLRAPAGFGKTTLMQQAFLHLRSAQVTVAWLTIDSADNDVSRLLQRLSHVLNDISASSRHIALPFADGPLALALFDSVTQMTQPFVLFFDDLETLQRQIALTLIKRLIEHLPAGGRMIIGSRSLPDIGLSNMRSRAQLLEVDSSLLRFSVEETEKFLSQAVDQAVPKSDVAQLHETTEGWPAALWMASLLLKSTNTTREFVSKFSGSNALIADYLGEQVLARLPRSLQEFMLRSCMLPQLSAPLCNAVLGINNSHEILVQLQRNHLFLQPLDQEHKLFRYHSMFATFLQQQLHTRHPEWGKELYLATSRWYQQQQQPITALEFALKTGDMSVALPQFMQLAQSLLDQGRAMLLTRLFDAIEPSQLGQWPQLQVVHVWSVAITRGASEAIALLSYYENSKQAKDALYINAMALRPMLLSMLDRHEQAYELALRDIDALPVKFAFAHAILRISLAYVTLVIGESEQARTLLDGGRKLNVIDSSAFTHIYAQCVEGVVELLQGRLRQAASRFRSAAGVDQRERRFETNGNAMAAILLAETLYQAGEHTECERLLKVYVPLMQQQGIPDHLICGHRNLARIHCARGELDSALHELNELEYYGQRNGLPRLIASAMLERSRLCLLAGDGETALEELQRAEAMMDWQLVERWQLFGNDTECPTIARLRWQIHFSDTRETISTINDLIIKAVSARRGRRVLKLKILLVLAYAQARREQQSLTLLRELLSTTLQEPCVQMFMDEGERLIDRLKKLAGAQHWVISEKQLRNPYALFERLRACEAVNTQVIKSSAQPSVGFEKLTKKEFAVLQLIAEGMSNAGIGKHLFVSENTVRTHVRNLNAKLQSQNRTESVAIARRLGILQ